MIRLTSTHASSVGKLIALNPAHIVAFYVEFEDETRISMIDGSLFIVSESFEQVMALIPECSIREASRER